MGTLLKFKKIKLQKHIFVQLKNEQNFTDKCIMKGMDFHFFFVYHLSPNQLIRVERKKGRKDSTKIHGTGFKENQISDRFIRFILLSPRIKGKEEDEEEEENM